MKKIVQESSPRRASPSKSPEEKKSNQIESI